MSNHRTRHPGCMTAVRGPQPRQPLMRHVCFRLRSQEGFEGKSPLYVLELYRSTVRCQRLTELAVVADRPDICHKTRAAVQDTAYKRFRVLALNHARARSADENTELMVLYSFQTASWAFTSPGPGKAISTDTATTRPVAATDGPNTKLSAL